MRPPVIVVGSGAAGLAAALAASLAGAEVLVLERAASVGGTTAISGGVVWAPGHHLRSGPGAGDDVDAAMAYLHAIALGDADRHLMRTFVDAAGPTVRDLEAVTPLRWEPLDDWPDYRTEAPGACRGGRSIWPRPLAVSPEVAGLVQASPGSEPPAEKCSPTSDGMVFRGPVRGRALIGGLLAACMERGVEVRTGARAAGLASGAGVGVGGVTVDGERIEGRVVLASGGFQHDRALVTAFLPGDAVVPLGTPGCAGDALAMAIRSGAALGNMTEGWWMPALAVPGEQLDDRPFYRPLHHERAQASSLMVDRGGRRFVNEACNYGDVGRAMLRFDTDYGWTASPAWLVFDARYRASTPLGPLRPADPDPPWLRAAGDLVQLAETMDIPGATLCDTVARFNAGARAGCDPDFGRGTHHYDRWIAGGPTLGPVDETPLYAVPVHAGCMGTKGGPRTDDCGRVRSSSGGLLPGLYAAGNAAASPFGIATAAGGATLGPALVFGRRAGEAAALDPG